MVPEVKVKEKMEELELVQHKLEERLYKGLVACLTKAEYRLGLDVHLDRDSRIFFFMKTSEGRLTREIRLPGMVGAGLGEKESLAVYKPMLKRQKSSFLRSFRKKPTVSSRLRRHVQASLRRKVKKRRYTKIENLLKLERFTFHTARSVLRGFGVVYVKW